MKMEGKFPVFDFNSFAFCDIFLLLNSNFLVLYEILDKYVLITLIISNIYLVSLVIASMSMKGLCEYDTSLVGLCYPVSSS